MSKKQAKVNNTVQAILKASPKSPVFNYPASKDDNKPRAAAGHTLRGMAIALLHGGATLKDVCELTERFYTARGSFPKTPVYQRAVELVRLVAKDNGYGLTHDTETGIISITG